MKKFTKIMLASGVTLMLGVGSVSAYLQAQQPLTPQEELTLANIEALARVENIGGENVWHIIPLDDYGSKRCDRGGTAFCLF